MTSTFLSGLRSVGAVLAGFVVITVGTVFTFTVLLDGIGLYNSGPVELAIGTLGAVASGLAGGLVAAQLAKRNPFWHAVALAIPISLDTISIILSDTDSDPLWFDLGGSAILLLGAQVGGYIVEAKRRSRMKLMVPN